ncbi:tRNA 2-thiouridine(34) synthase MnmA [Mucisphaera calidilacus]|uniref:tRNA-specific 2-thiouridylase MnmA n=1 Tax=Mucisphaera calidilacus TaxID=2527982 RepID=A0A518BZJ1_9BACT|nr:tRNA 2-thiouridine(34) synthase MnmA [Mucisphaera calidilacus]QDU72379.1 tRNA-specific 2-thiouridylase MnmA [Mucisphaera calidilacus]
MAVGTGKKVVLAMSGGVDSSAAAALLLEDGYEVVGCFMRLGSESPEPEACDTSGSRKQGCCSVNDAADARHVAAILGIPFYVLNFKDDFGRIIDHFVREYHAGRTPNPCVRCNDWLKFGKLHDYARSIDADFVASGHYARIDRSSGGARLRRGLDRRKDQSYVLFGADEHRRAQMLLPIGGLQKDETRRIAEQAGLPVFNKPDSQEICFVPDNDYARLVTQRSEPGEVASGRIVDTEGKDLGEHPGHQHFTIGQRRGLNLALGYPIYVVDKRPESNTVTVGGREHLLASGAVADQITWHESMRPSGFERCDVKIRYNSSAVPARVCFRAEDEIEVRFAEPVEAVTPGQAVVCYREDLVLGGGWIREALPVSA